MNLLQAINHGIIRDLFFVVLLTGYMLSIPACSKSNFEEVDTREDGRLYSGVGTLNSWTYAYDTIAYSGTTRDTFSGYLKYQIEEDPIINENDTTYQIIQYWRPNDTTQFIISRVETIRIEKGRYIVSQDGLNFIKLVFPIYENTSWLGNSLFDTSDDITEIVGGEIVETISKGFEWRYRVDSLNFPLEIGELSFEDALSVNLVNHQTNVSERIVNEVYAKNVGLVSKNMSILNRPNQTEFPLSQDANKGYTMVMALIEYN